MTRRSVVSSFVLAVSGGSLLLAHRAQSPAAVLEKEEIHASSVSGIVLTPSDEAIEAASIQLQLSSSQKIASQTTTDTAGQFKLKRVQPGRYLLTISSPGFISHRWDVEITSSGEPASIKARLTPGL